MVRSFGELFFRNSHQYSNPGLVEVSRLIQVRDVGISNQLLNRVLCDCDWISCKIQFSVFLDLLEICSNTSSVFLEISESCLERLSGMLRPQYSRPMSPYDPYFHDCQLQMDCAMHLQLFRVEIPELMQIARSNWASTFLKIY